ncbi:hypothetical protein [Marinoscillum furvescens]|uniref:Uncharacterized protein n=1 Tax=Marinoscillum furvescens DSM 4134 TaxID=1122208 RepID=A0A3D9L1K1_MARFU|nr:hypothetical protein [Marinoscillum furvescens]RED96977.1 hypothetical protein C7460_11325 [Marinoscillum furvescens DSM 4134]
MNDSLNVMVTADFSLTCQHPIEGLKLLREIQKNQKPVPAMLFVRGTHGEDVIDRFISRVERMFGQAGPELIMLR